MVYNFCMTKAHQSGNVLFLILIAVALFAALSYAVTQSTRSGGANAENEKISLDIGRVRGHAVNLKMSIARMLTNGGQNVDNLNFFYDGFTEDYTNPNCTNSRCEVFGAMGGGALWDKPPFTITGDDYIISGYSQIPGIGSDAPGDPSASELILIVPYVSETTCLAINKFLGMHSYIPTETSGCLVDKSGTDFYFKGSYGIGNVIEDTSRPEATRGKFEMCVRCPGSPASYHYYEVLIAR
jgi:hypothetical protein